jgi:hypothetical protein
MKLTHGDSEGSACVLCGATTSAKPMGFTPEAARLFEQQFGHGPDALLRRIRERCRSLNPEERKALARKAFTSTSLEMLCDMGLNRKQALEVDCQGARPSTSRGFF